MRREIEKTLEKLVTSHNSVGRPVITGFNYYPTCLEIDLTTVISLSNIHSSQDYWRSAIEGLGRMGYPNENVSISTRDKKGYFRWKPDFLMKDEKGNVEEGLVLTDTKTGEDLDLAKISHPTLRSAGYSNEEVERIIGKNKGYEINVLTSDIEALRKLASEFLKKSSLDLYDEEGEPIPETVAECDLRQPWQDAWEMPILIIGGKLYGVGSLPVFREARLFRFQDRDIGEFMFVINKEIKSLRRCDGYRRFLGLGFREEVCLGNTRFIKEYVDKL